MALTLARAEVTAALRLTVSTEARVAPDLTVSPTTTGTEVTVPLTALFRNGDRWALFVEDGGRANLRHVDIGHRNSIDAEITSGV